MVQISMLCTLAERLELRSVRKEAEWTSKNLLVLGVDGLEDENVKREISEKGKWHQSGTEITDVLSLHGWLCF